MTTGSTIARFTITLSKSVAEPVQVAWNTKDGTAKAGVDYAAASGTAVFSPGETNKDVDVLVYGRAVGTEDRNFFLEMTPPPNAILGESIGECIIYLDTAGNTAVIQVIVPTGPQGVPGEPGPEGPPGPKGDTPTAEDIKDSEFAAKGTSALSPPDMTTIAETARRVAYAADAKIATVVLADGDNLLAQSDLTGDVVDFNSVGLYPRIMRGVMVISPQWIIQTDGRLLIKSALAGDVLYVCQYDVISEQAVNHTATAEQFGAVGDGFTDDTAAFVAANATLPEHSYLALKAGKNYLISGVTFTKGISMGCPAGQAFITSNSGCAWVVDAEYLNVTVENLIFIPRLVPDRNSPTTAISIELVTKNYGGSGYSRVINTRVRRNGALAYYNGIRMKNCPSIIDRCDISLAGSTSALAYAGDVDAWAENSGDGVLLDSTTYSFVHETKSYYGQNGFRVTGQIEDSHFVGCMALVNRVCYLYEDLILPSNEHRVTRSHGVAYFKGIDMATDGNAGRIGFCSVSECSIMVPPECTVAGVIYLGGLFDGANISAFQAYRSSSRGSSDKAIYLPTSGSFGSRRTVINGLHCYGVKTGVYINTAERVNITNVNMLQFNMVGASTSVYEYGPNATGIVSSAYGFQDAENIFTGRLSCGVISATTSIGLKTANTVTGNGADKFRIIDAAGNFRFESVNSDGVLQYNAGIDQEGPFRTKSIYPLVDDSHYLGSGVLRWKTVFATSATINTSDERAKTSISSINDAVLDAWQDVDWNNQFRLKSSLIAQGVDGARWHFGLIAQRVEAVFASHGIDGFTLGLLCFDEWGEQEEIIEAVPAITNDEGVVIEPGYTYVAQPARDAGSRYGIRYEEALALEAALQRRERKRDREAFEVFKSEVLVRLQQLEA